MTGATKKHAARTPGGLQHATLLLRPQSLELFAFRFHVDIPERLEYQRFVQRCALVECTGSPQQFPPENGVTGTSLTWTITICRVCVLSRVC